MNKALGATTGVRIINYARRLKSTLDLIAARVEPPGADLVLTSRILRDMQLLLGRLVDRLPQRFIEDVEVDYLVGSSDDGDAVVWSHTTRAEQGYGVLLRTWGETIIPSPLPRPTYDSIGVTVNADSGTCRALPILDDETHIAGIVEFEPAISTDPVNWTLSYSFPGLWRPLRMRGRDTMTHRMTPQANLSSMRVRFTFPVGVKAAFDPAPAGGQVQSEVINGQQTLMWRLVGDDLKEWQKKNPEPGHRRVIVLQLRADGFVLQ